MMVMSTHGRTGVASAVMGSVAALCLPYVSQTSKFTEIYGETIK